MPIDAELDLVVRSWARLPVRVRAGTAAMVKEVIDGKTGVRGTLRERIEAAVKPTLLGLEGGVKIERLRKATREGLFLSILWTRCNLNTLELEPELRATSALVACDVLLVLRSEHDDPYVGHTFGVMQNKAIGHRRHLRSLKEAAVIVGRQYFDGLLVQHALIAITLFMDERGGVRVLPNRLR